jgi:iron(III) transport system ATP-binding protein
MVQFLDSAPETRWTLPFGRRAVRLADDGAPDVGAPAAAATGSAARAAARLPGLALEGVSHRYGTRLAVDRVSLEVGAGEIVCLVGPSGCGKSTLLRVAAGLEDLQQGTVRIGGQVVADATVTTPPERRGVGLVFQDYALFPHLSVRDNVGFGLNRLPAAERQERVAAALRQVGMQDYAGAYPHALSGGQQQRIALARALAPRPAVLLLDEPFSGLDTRLREQVRDQTLHVLKQSGCATMVVTHDPEEAMFLADRIALMRDGRIVQVGSPTDLYMRPTCDFAAGFFGEVNRLAGTVRGGVVTTPLGVIPAPGHGEGSAVTVLVRPEHLRLAGPHGPVTAEVEAARLLGRATLVHLCLPDGQGDCVHLHARIAGAVLPAEGSRVTVDFDPAQAFVFPAAGAI